MTSFIIFSDVVYNATIDEISIKSVLKSILSKMQYSYWRRIKFKVAEISVLDVIVFR